MQTATDTWNELPGPPLRTIYYYLARECNLACRHCWITPKFAQKIGHYLRVEQVEKIALEAKAIGLRSFKFTGGEPFLHPQACELMYMLKGHGIGVFIETNATLIGEKEARALRDNVHFISVSLDGATKEVHEGLRQVPGCWEQTLAGLAALRAAGLGFQVIFCLHQQNHHQLFEMVDVAKSLGATSLKINVISGIGRSDKMNSKGELLGVAEILAAHKEVTARYPLESTSKDMQDADGFKIIFDVPPAFKTLAQIERCGLNSCGIVGILGLLHNGRAGLCGVGEYERDLDFGDMLSEGVANIWFNNPVLKRLRREVPHNLGGICGRCLMKHYCLGKCLAQNYIDNKTLDRGHTFCETAYAEGLFPESRLDPRTSCHLTGAPSSGPRPEEAGKDASDQRAVAPALQDGSRSNATSRLEQGRLARGMA